MIAEKFMKSLTFIELIKFLNGSDDDDDGNYFGNYKTCDNKCCENFKNKDFFIGIINAGYYMYNQEYIGLGTFLSNFANLTDAKKKGGGNKLGWSAFDLEKQLKIWVDFDNEHEHDCEKFSKTDMFFHDYFKNLASATGFPLNYSLSLIDIPSIFRRRVNENTETLTVKEAFLQSQCEMDTLVFDFHSCYSKLWTDYIYHDNEGESNK